MGYVALLRHNVDFRRLWLGVVVSFFGDWFSTIALFTMVQALTDSGQALAGVLIAKTLPIFLMTPIAGPIVDRFDRRVVLISTDIVRFFLTLGIVAGWWMESLTVVLGCLVLRTAASGVFLPARNAVIPQLTTTTELPEAMALNGGTWSMMLAVGAALGGLATEAAGITGALAIDALTFLAAAWFLSGLPELPPRATGEATTQATFRDGVRYLSGRVYLPSLLLLKSGLALGAGALVTIPLYGNGLFPLAGPLWVGALYASRGLGALLGSVGLRRLSGDDSEVLQRAITPFFLVNSAGYMLLAWAPGMTAAAVGLLVAAIGNGVIWVFSGILGQRAIPRSYRGRLFAMEFGGMTLISAASSWSAGLSIDTLGWDARRVALAAGIAVLAPGLLWAVVRWRAPDLPSATRPVESTS